MAKGKARSKSVTQVSKDMGARPADMPGPKVVGTPAGKFAPRPDETMNAEKKMRLEQEKMAIEAVRLAKAAAQKAQAKIELMRTIAMLNRQSKL